MKIIAGLGNPGKKYKDTRHNAGFIFLDELKDFLEFPDFKLSKKINSLVSEKDNIILVKPQSFMNNSGKVIKEITKDAKELVVIHDDVDIKTGDYKISQDSKSAGHKGVQSIIDQLKTKDFKRIRIGIMPKQGRPENTELFVIENFSKEEKKELKKVIEEIIKKYASLLAY